MKNSDPISPWTDPEFNRPNAPHVRDPDNPDKPWNKVFWSPQDLTTEEKRYYKMDYKMFLYGNPNLGAGKTKKRKADIQDIP